MAAGGHPGKGWLDADSPQRRAAGLLAESAAPDRRVLLGALLGLALAAALEALGPILSKLFIDRYLVPRLDQITHIALLLGGALAAGSLASLLRFWQLTRMAGLAMRSLRRLRERVYRHVLQLPVQFFDHAVIGRLVSRVTNDSEAVKALYVQVLFVMLDSLIVLTGSLTAMAWLDPRLMVVVALLGPAVFAIVWIYQRWSAPAVARTRQLRGELNAQLGESIGGMAVLQASGAAQRFGQRFADTNHGYYDSRQTELRANAWLLRPALELVNTLLLAVVVGVFGLREFGGTMSALEVGVLYAFISYLSRVTEPLTQFTMQFSMLQQSVVAASRVADLLAEPLPAMTDGRHSVGSGELRIEGLGFAYQPDRAVLQGLDLSVPSGAFYGIAGHTGAGKSTLFALLLRFYPPSAGSITLDGRPLDQIGPANFRQAVGVVPQDPFLLAASVRDNIDMGRGLPDEQVLEAAHAARADHFIEELADGYQTLLGEGGARLSVGQKQLLAIARALAGRPRVLLLDEATAHIDSETEIRVQRALAALRGRVTVIAIAHRLSTIRQADRIVVLNHGRIAEQGSHAELVAIDGGIYRRLHELQQIEARTLEVPA